MSVPPPDDAITDLDAMRHALARGDERRSNTTTCRSAPSSCSAGRVIAARHNERELRGDPVAHAEVLALQDAARQLGQWRLDECTMYVTLEPCAMCAGAMVNARLGRVVYAATDPKAGAARSVYELLDGDKLNHRVEISSGILADESAELLRAFFRARR